jgi:FimV-like protein
VAAAPVPALPDDLAAPVARLDTSLPVTPPPAVAEPWYLQYLWLPWALLGLLGLSVIWLLFRRPPGTTSEADAELPRFEIERAPATRADALHSAAALRQAEDDLRALEEESLPAFEDRYAAAEPLGRQEPSQEDLAVHEAPARVASTDAPVDSAIDESKRLADRPEPGASDSPISDDDIASWVAELDAETEGLDVRSANDSDISLDEDIPSILTELDDQITRADPVDKPIAAGIELEPLEEIATDDADDDTFSMSLDLARAYLEIGDQDGARDMLEQALASTADPEHRRQIEELLQQIG